MSLQVAVTASRCKLEGFQFQPIAGWSRPFPRELDGEKTLVIAFGSPSLAQEPSELRKLSLAFPNSVVVGCSTAGEISGAELSDNSISAAVIRFEHTTLRQAIVRVGSPDESHEAGAQLARQLATDELKAVLVFSDGLAVNGTALVNGINSIVGPDVVVTGGLAGDGTAFKKTWVLEKGEPVSGIVCAVAFYGNHIRIGHGSRGGWDPFGPERIITRSSGNVLYELDEKPALDLYKQYLGDRASGLPSSALLFPLTVAVAGHPPLVRTILAVDEVNKTMTFAGDMPQGAIAQLMRANFDRIIDAATNSAESALPDADRGPTLSLVISCVGRRLVLGERTEEELEAAAQLLRPEDLQIGFYSYGELSPVTSGRCELHNQTMTVTTISEVE